MKKEELTNLFMEFVEDQFPELIEEEKGPFNYGDRYYCISTSGQVGGDYWINHQLDEGRLSIGNTFKTREEAEFVLEKLKVIHELEMLGRPFKPGEKNYYIAFDTDDDEIIFYREYRRKSAYFDYYFDTEEKAREAIDKIGEDRIKKYLFGVEEE